MKFLFPLFFAGICNGQEILQPQPDAQVITTFKFRQYSGGVIMVNAKVDTLSETFNFILDTGSSGISLDSTTCELFNIETVPSDTTVVGMGSARKVHYVFDKKLHFPGLTISNLNFHINNYQLLSSVYGERIDGIIGYSFFSRYIVKIDFDSLEIAIYSPGEIEYDRRGTLLRPVINRLPAQELVVKDQRKVRSNYYFDTGAGLCLLMNEQFVKDSSVLVRKRKPIHTQTEGLGGKLAMRITVVKTLQIGRFRFRNVPAHLYEDMYNVTAYPRVTGLLGNDLLRRFNLTVNYPKGEIHLVPNSHYREPFDYAYTGLGIYFENGQILIQDVLPGSPGEKCGLQPGDVLIGVDNNLSNNINQYKTLLQSGQGKIKLIISRNGELIQTSLRPDSIF
ncbi:MAG TPA: aspartyl protease family protein [Chitinophagaceae bacterium]